MKQNEVMHGFRVTGVRAFRELGGSVVEMEHIKTGAKLCWLDRPDANKAFSIAFKTLPEDSTGVFHILEHSVLCGSDRYPVKEPFVELLKSSVQTFLNAMTFPDKTVYPVSTRNDRDFLNLIDVYLDAVLHPAIYHKPEIFRQEGWHYEGEGEDLCYQGVVFNEMKGAFASPQTVLYNALQRLLFPDNCYRHVSGGDPQRIPDLTYEQFIEGHRKYYHPSNARISLVGTIDADAVLRRIDSYLSAFDRAEADFAIPMQKPVDSVTEVVPFEIGADEPAENRAIIASATLLGGYDDKERRFAAAVLADYLTGDNDAPLKRAVIDRGLAQDFSLLLDDGVQQAIAGWSAINTERENLSALQDAVRETLTGIVEKGLDRERLSACFHRYAFNMRDHDDKGYPRSLLEAIGMLDTWLYGGDPADGLTVESALQSLEKKLFTGCFEQLIRELFLENTHTVTVVLTPSDTLGAEKRAAEAARLKQESENWTEADRARVRAEAEALKLWQQTPDSEEALKTIPMLQLSDLNDKPEPLCMTETVQNGVPVMAHTVGSEIAFLKAHFAASDLRPEELPALSVLCRMLGSMATKQHSRAELPLAVKSTIGRLDFTPNVLPGKRPENCSVMLSASVACLRDQAENAAALLGEMLTETVWDDVGLLRDILQQMAAGAKISLAGDGMRYAILRVSSYRTGAGAANERIGGISFVQWMNKTLERGDEALKELLADMKRIAERLVTRGRLVVSRSEALPASAVDALLQAIPADGGTPPKEAAYPLPGATQEGVVIPAQIGYAVTGTNLYLHGRTFHGSIPVLANVLNYLYLWSEIRVQGGAYGCGFFGRDSGDVAFYTYRDPQPNRSLGVIRKAADFVRTFCDTDPDLTGAILSAVSALDPLRGAEEKISAAESRRFRGITEEEIDARYRTLIRTTPQDLLALCGMLEDVAAENAVCVAAGRDLLEACGDTLKDLISI